MANPSLLQIEIKKEKDSELIVRDHPSNVIEISPVFNNVDNPEANYILDLPEQAINSGALSAIQLETIIYSCQRHEQNLSDGSRAGFLIGDGAGVGKGRIAAGIIFENFIRGRKKSIWFSISTDLKYDAEGDLRDIGCADKIAVHAVNKLKNFTARTDVTESTKEGVIFCTYSDLINELSSSKKRLLCLEQLLKWCGPNFDGVIVFDECHLTNDINFSGSTNKRKTELAVLQLQNKLPNARIVYISTTAIWEPRSMESMVRLGLWGQDTPFKDFEQFLENVKTFGEIAGDMIAMEMRQRGSYVNRQLPFKDVMYQVVEICQLPKFIRSYDNSAKLWLHLQQSFTEAAELMDLGQKTQKIMWTNFWSAYNRFFRCLRISAKVIHAVKFASEAVKRGKSVVIGLQSTGENYTLQKVPDDGSAMPNFVSTAKMVMQSLVEKHFPVSDSLHLFADARNNKRTVGGKRKHVRKTAGTSKKKKNKLTDDFSCDEIIDSSDVSAPVFDYNSDSADSKLKDEEAAEDRRIKLEKASVIKQGLLEKIEEIGTILPPNWIDQLIDELGGSENVAEISSRKGRLVQKNNGLVQYEPRSEKDVPLDLINIRERERFMNGEKKIAIVSAAASCGISLHADRRAKNQSRRIYISLELPNSAELALQQFGCIHRSNQVKAPKFILLVPELAGERRSALIVANRLQFLGASFKNQSLDEGSTELEETSEYDSAVLDAMKVIMGHKSPVSPVPADYEGNFFRDIRAALAEVGVISSNLQQLVTLFKAGKGVPDILNRISGIPVNLQATLLIYFDGVRSATISNRGKMDGHYDTKIFDLQLHNKCAHRRKALKVTSKNTIGPATMYLHEIEVDGGMDWRTAEEKWFPKAGQADEGIYVSKEVLFKKRDIIIVRRFKIVSDGDKGDLKYTVIRPSTGVQLLSQTLAEITTKYIPKISLSKQANIDHKALWDFHYDASENVCVHDYWLKNTSKSHKNKGPGRCQEGLRSSCVTYKLLTGSIFLLWKEIESIIRESNPQWKMQIARVLVDSSKIVGIVIPDNCESQLVAFLTK
ncbi:protein strawberry notch-like [Daphnia pulex]|uniref:protein strawberry notch-like n=1 Tax=Daphnia pulex TaxID=6669 RepID=UPI001EDFDD75|nr:protein strawberry notch-like [Daphnia pulex]